MTALKDIKIANYNYELPDERIAKYPLAERDQSKLLVYKDQSIENSTFSDITEYLDKGKLLVFNNTKVIQARLEFYKETGARIEIFCLEPIEPHDFALAFQERKSCSWKCIVGNKKKWKEKAISHEFTINGEKYSIKAEKIEDLQTAVIVRFSWDNEKVSFGELLESIGNTPIPPYLNRKSEDSDKKNYQTVY